MEKRRTDEFSKNEKETIEKVLKIDRVTKVVKGGKRLAFRALVVSGDNNGKVGVAQGKAKEVPAAIKKAIDKVKKNMKNVRIVNGTIPHMVMGKFGAARVLMKPAREGTGVIAGGSIRIVLEAAGIKNVVAKSIGSDNKYNTACAAIDGINQLKDLKEEYRKRGKKLPVYKKEETVNAEEDVTPKVERDLKAEKESRVVKKKDNKTREVKPRNKVNNQKEVKEGKNED